MTIQDLIDIARDEGRDPRAMHLVIPIGGTYYNVEMADEQDRWNPNYVCMAISRIDNEMGV